MRKTFATATLILSMGFLGGCISGADQTPNQADISGEWVFVGGVDSSGEFFDETDSMGPVTFEEGTVHGQICNNFSGPFEAQGNKVTIGAIMSTEMYCTEPAGLMDLESRFLVDLGAITTISIDTNGIQLTNQAGTSLNFERAPGN